MGLLVIKTPKKAEEYFFNAYTLSRKSAVTNDTLHVQLSMCICGYLLGYINYLTKEFDKSEIFFDEIKSICSYNTTSKFTTFNAIENMSNSVQGLIFLEKSKLNEASKSFKISIMEYSTNENFTIYDLYTIDIILKKIASTFFEGKEFVLEKRLLQCLKYTFSEHNNGINSKFYENINSSIDRILEYI